MKLWHWTWRANVDSILRDGLKPSHIGVVYLTPNPQRCSGFGDVLLEVETGGLRLTCFEGCEEWEVLCWGHIPSKDIQKKT